MAEPDRGSPEWWRDRLLTALIERQKNVTLLERYYDGDHPLPQPPQKMQSLREAVDAFSSLSKMGVTNYVPLIADAPADRLQVTGFRFGEVENLGSDDEAWLIWQRSHLDAESRAVHHKALETGQSFVLVWKDKNGLSQITPEHPSQAIVAYEPGSLRLRRAGLKAFVDYDVMQLRVVLYLRDKAAYKWTCKVTETGQAEGDFVRWVPEGDSSWPIALPTADKSVPLIEFRANPSLKPSPFGGGVGEYERVLAIQDRINKTVFDRLVTAEFQAFRQRWAVGWTPDNPNDAIKASMSRMMSFEDKDVTVGEFAQADFTMFIKAVESDVQAMAAITRTPTFYTLGSIANISGDALTALQSGLIAKTEKHRDNFSESWEEVLRLALAIEKNPKAADQQSMVLWADLEHRTWAERADAVLKMSTLGVPREALWAMLPNVTPQDIKSWRVMAAAQGLFDAEPDEQTATSGAA